MTTEAVMIRATRPVEVLNTTYEKVGPTSLSRAIALLMRGEAVIEESDPHISVRAMDAEFPLPLIIRLLRFVKVPITYGPKAWTKAGVLTRDGYKCAYCKKKGANIVKTIDHVLPRAQGGRDTWENTVACCSGCNSKKADRTPEQAGMTLLYTPTVPMRIFHSTKGARRS